MLKPEAARRWGDASAESLNNGALIREDYAGIRPTPVDPACPDYSEKPALRWRWPIGIGPIRIETPCRTVHSVAPFAFGPVIVIFPDARVRGSASGVSNE